MHRRQLMTGIGALLAAPLMTQGLMLAQGTPVATPATSGFATDQAAVLFRWRGEDGIRSVMVRVSQWDDLDAAASFHDLVLHSGGSNLPLGEFYQSEPTPYALNEIPQGVEAGMVRWTTTVGVAAFETGFALLSMLKGALLWDVVVRASSEMEAVALAGELMFVLAERVPPPCSSLAGYLPEEGDVPIGATAEDYDYPVNSPEFGDMDSLNLPPVPMPTTAERGCGSPA
jgi:hypothetical protein